MDTNRMDRYFLKVAKDTAELSKCKKSKVGAVIVKDNRIISCGYNGTPSGWKEDSEYECEDVLKKCPKCGSENIIEYDAVTYLCQNCNKEISFNSVKEELITKNHIVVHAEMNAIAFAAKEGISTKGATLYVTMSPCPDCAKLIAQSGIKRVVFTEKYRKNEGIKFLRMCGVKIEHLKISL